jgi:prepilin-type N-terminal cleavage/methylation domain-containing protein
VTDKANPKAGVTLLEMLLALAIMSMIGVATAQLFSATGAFWRRAAGMDAISEAALTRRDLWESVERMPTIGPELPLPEIFETTAAGFRFRSEDGIWQEVSASEGSIHVTNEEGLERRLRDDISRVQITYFGSTAPRMAAGWTDDWSGAVRPPELIKIESWRSDGVAYPPITMQPAWHIRQSVISESSLVPPG